MEGPGGSGSGALRYAYRLLNYRDRSERELRERLERKGYAADEVDGVVEALRAQGFVDDRRLAAVLRRQAVEAKHLGRKGTAQFLLRRGIPPDLVSEVSGSDDDYLDSAVNLLRKKTRKAPRDLDEETEKRRLWGALSRRGFSSEMIRQAMKYLETKEE